ncbi:MAG: EpsG family protein [Eubacterium sp.]|nr:EpsG family protein [Eubacterium sp.]
MPLFFRNIKKGKDIYCTAAMLLLICVQGFRTENLGLYDVKNVYFPSFQKIMTLSFLQVFETYPIVRGNFFQIATKLFTLICDNKYIWLFICSIPYLAAMKHNIKKYSLNIYVCAFSFFLIMGLRIYSSNFFLIRHSIAMGFLVLAFDGIMEKNLRKFLIFTLIAVMFHTTAAVFLIAYPLARIKPSWKQIAGIAAGFYVILYLASDLMNMIFELMDSSNYYFSYKTRNSGFDSLTFPIICGIMFAAAFVLTEINQNKVLSVKNGKNKPLRVKNGSNKNEVSDVKNGSDKNKTLGLKKGSVKKKALGMKKGSVKKKALSIKNAGVLNDLNYITVNMLCIGTLFMGASTIIGEFYRLSYFFMTVSFAGLGNIISQEKNRVIRRSIYVLLIAYLFIFMYRGLEPQGLVPYESWLF